MPSFRKCFQIALCSTKDICLDINRHRIAFYSEEDAESFVSLALEKGAFEVTCKDFIGTPFARKGNNNKSTLCKRQIIFFSFQS